MEKLIIEINSKNWEFLSSLEKIENKIEKWFNEWFNENEEENYNFKIT